eukprot:1193918-Prorocentrum_minimum.AAC.6
MSRLLEALRGHVAAVVSFKQGLRHLHSVWRGHGAQAGTEGSLQNAKWAGSAGHHRQTPRGDHLDDKGVRSLPPARIGAWGEGALVVRAAAKCRSHGKRVLGRRGACHRGGKLRKGSNQQGGGAVVPRCEHGQEVRVVPHKSVYVGRIRPVADVRRPPRVRVQAGPFRQTTTPVRRTLAGW